MQNNPELIEKLNALLDAERELRDALEECEDHIDADLPDSLDSLDAALAKALRSERICSLQRELRRPAPTPASTGPDVAEFFDRR